MPAFLLSSAPGINASSPGVSLLSKNPEAMNNTAQTTGITGSFGESLSASMASLVKISQADSSDTNIDLAKLSASLEELSGQLEALDPALFEALRGFLNGQDLSLQGLQSMQAGGELPDFFADLQASFALETGLDSLTELEMNALDATIVQISSLIQPHADVQLENDAQASATLPGLAFSINKDGKIVLGNQPGGEQVQPQNWHASAAQQVTPLSSASQAQASQSAAVPFDPTLNTGLNDVVTETDKSFNAHFESLKSEIPSDAAEALLESAPEVKDKAAGIARLSEQQFRTLNETFKPYSTTLMTPVDAQEWADEVSQKIVWFTGRNIQAAEMHLNPADLGPIDVKINVQNDVASVSFNVQNASVRELLESNVVRLREMMESNGVSLGDVNVDSGNQDAYQEAQQTAQQLKSTKGSGQEQFTDDEPQVQTLSLKKDNLVDYFV